MKNKFAFLLIVLTVISCSVPKNKSDKIEFMAYNWSRYNDSTRMEVPFFFKCRMYANLDNTGVGDVYVYHGYPQVVTYYFKVSVDKNIIDKILNSANVVDSNKFKVFDGVPLIYDGPILKLRIININNGYKYFDFIDLNYNNEVNNFIRLYHALDSLFLLKKYNNINDTTDFENSRSEFVKFTINYDTTHYAKAPKPSPIDSIEVKNITPDKKQKN